MSRNEKELKFIYSWSARKMHPIILVYVSLVFLIFILLSYFVFDSSLAVKTLLFTAIGTILPLFTGIATRFEYRLSKQSLEYRQIKNKKSTSYKKIFDLDEVNHFKQLKHGFKYYLKFKESNPFLRFWKMYFSDKYSGEIHIETADREMILNALNRCEILLK